MYTYLARIELKTYKNCSMDIYLVVQIHKRHVFGLGMRYQRLKDHEPGIGMWGCQTGAQDT